MKAYARNLDANIVALQEVGSEQAVHSLFPKEDWQVFFSGRADSEAYTCRESGANSTQQKVAFAVKKPLRVASSASLHAFGLQTPGLRHALALDVQTDIGPLKLLNVHLKSGCFVDDHTKEDSRACEMLSQQARLLDSWIEKREQSAEPYAVLGDFNHRLSAPYNRLTRTLSQNQDGKQASLNNATSALIGCHPYYPATIDHILVGHMSDTQFSLSADVQHYERMDPEDMLSDHCAVTLSIKQVSAPITNAVKWQTQSAEYGLLTRKIYQQASPNTDVAGAAKRFLGCGDGCGRDHFG